MRRCLQTAQEDEKEAKTRTTSLRAAVYWTKPRKIIDKKKKIVLETRAESLDALIILLWRARNAFSEQDIRQPHYQSRNP